MLQEPIDVLVLGGAGVDTIVPVPELPLPFADSHQVPEVVTRAGQTGDFVALGLAALGLRTHHLDLLGEDHEGSLVRELHAAHGIPLTAFALPRGTRRAVNLVGPDGRRLSLYDASRGSAEDRFPAPVLRELAGASRHVHVAITRPCAAALPELIALGVPLSTDLHDWDGVNPYHEPFALAADVVFLSAAALGDPEPTMRRILREGRAEVVVATAGADGSRVLTAADGEPRHQPAVAPPAPVVDSNGAGDAYAAGFLYGMLSGEPLARCARYGAVAGAHACTVPAVRVAPLGRDELHRRTTVQ
ncbi:PfkB family carbohydrate kinase [Kitasatospora viridis]|uniref:Sugar/nucleoside kinase (Ribokinase family) n=1 Tax=Kitasatospora viridis TaxID=281105 RepID=A0A561UPM4_9ACTN|nr:PfkB family carbohydrate kinase [Kitasatospora viridis]TWG01300.1 sugar/nucleoside kinase (ribokinase family) [Kitasatospora viridis]